MIAANDLRVNNWFYRDGHLWQYTEDNMTTVWYNLENLEPIPLTPEILIKCGFIRNDELSNSKENYEFPKRMGLFFLSKTVTAINETTYYNISFPGKHGSCYLPAFNQCQYLHQLQNLYFALTNSELEIKSLIK